MHHHCPQLGLRWFSQFGIRQLATVELHTVHSTHYVLCTTSYRKDTHWFQRVFAVASTCMYWAGLVQKNINFTTV